MKLKLCVSIVLVLFAAMPAWSAFGDENGDGGRSAADSDFPYRGGDWELGASIGYAWGFQVGRPNPQLEDVEMLSFAPRVGIAMGDSRGVGRWWEVGSQIFAEGTFLWQRAPHSGTAFGAALMFRFNALGPRAATRLVPFFSIGGGVVSLDFDLVDQDDGLSFTPQLGLGLRYMLGKRSQLEFEWRYHHISNAKTHPPNHGINTNLFSLGTSLFF